MPFHDTKDKIESIETYKRITIAVTKNGHVYAIGDKLKKILKIKALYMNLKKSNLKLKFIKSKKVK